MNLYLWPVMIFVTFLALMLGVGWLCEHGARQLERVLLLDQLDQATASVQLPPPLPRAGRLAHQGAHEPAYLPGPPFARDPEPGYGPFPVDTGPLLLLSEQAAANVALEREIRQRCAEAEAQIPPRWRS